MEATGRRNPSSQSSEGQDSPPWPGSLMPPGAPVVAFLWLSCCCQVFQTGNTSLHTGKGETNFPSSPLPKRPYSQTQHVESGEPPGAAGVGRPGVEFLPLKVSLRGLVMPRPLG